MGNNTERVFFELLRAGLWEKDIRLLPFTEIDYTELLNIAEQQSVVGLVAAGLNRVVDIKPVKSTVMQFIGKTILIEQKNIALNRFIGSLTEKMRKAGIYTLLVKGQGIAQCYERPMWRACGDVDFFMDINNYERAKAFLTSLATSVDPEGVANLHYGMTIDSWTVELHGSLRCGLSTRIDKVIDEVQRDTFTGGKVRAWRNGETDIFLPGIDNDVVFVFTHFLKHFYKGGLGLRQICDWSRLIWLHQSDLNVDLLEQRLRKMGLISEWKAFAAFAVQWLGMDSSSMPFYSNESCWMRKASCIQRFVMMSGNFGYNRDNTYYQKYPYLIRKCFSLARRIGDLINHTRIFPLDSLRFFPKIMINGLQSAVRRE